MYVMESTKRNIFAEIMSECLITGRNVVAQGNVFTPFCDSVHGGCLVDTPQRPEADTLLGPEADIPLWAETPPGLEADTSPWTDTPLGRHPKGPEPNIPLGRHPQGRHPPKTATVADGAHPTGMHSCFISEEMTLHESVLYSFNTFKVAVHNSDVV